MDPDLEKKRLRAIAIARARIKAQAPAEPEVDKPKTLGDTVGDIAQVTSSALSPYAAAAAGGAAAGAPFGGVGAIPGAAMGVTALAAGDIGTSLYNLGAPVFGAPRVQTPSETIRKGLYKVGVGKAPETAGGRIYHDILSAAGGAGAGAQGANVLAQRLAALSPRANTTSQLVMKELGRQPGVQAAAGGGAAATTSALQEAGVDNPLLLTAGGLAGGMATGAAANRMMTPKPVEANIPSTQDLRDLSQEAYKRSEAEGVVFSNPTTKNAAAAQAALPTAQKLLKAIDPTSFSTGAVSETVATAKDILKKMGRPAPAGIDDLTGEEQARAYVKAAEDAVNAPTYRTLVKNIETALDQADFNPTMDTPIRSVVKEMKNVRSGSVSFEQLNNWNSRINEAIKGRDPYIVRWGMTVKNAIDDYILDPKSAAIGNSPAAREHLIEGRALWTQMRKSETIEELLDKAQRNIERGQDPIPALKTQFNNLANNRKQFRLFTKEEQAAIRSVIKGSRDQKTMEMLGSLIPGGRNFSSILPLMFAGITGVPGAMAVAGSAAAKSAANRIAMEQAERVAGFMRGGQLTAPRRPNAFAPSAIGATKGASSDLNQNAMRPR